MFTAIPVGLIYAGRAIRQAPDRGFAWGGLVLALAGAAFMAITLVMLLLGD